MKIEIPIVNAFVDENEGGNPAGVVLDAERFSDAEKQRIAAAVGLSETAFVSPSTTADFKLDFFTPSRQIAHCGHATIATFNYLRQVGMLPNDKTSKETIDGRREILMEGDSAYMEQLAPTYVELEENNHRRVLASLGINPANLLADTSPCIVNTGVSFLVISLRNATTVKSVKPDLKIINSISEALDLIGYYIFSPQTEKEDRDAGARMFAPRYGISEESATGMAAGPLACYLHDKLNIEKSQYFIEQGHLMVPPSPSVINVRLQVDNDAITRLMAGGKAAISETRIVEI